MTIDRRILAAAAADPHAPAWGLVLEHCHGQEAGDPSGSAALLPWLARTCAAFSGRDREPALGVAGVAARIAGAAGRASYAAEIATLRALARDRLDHGTPGEHRFIHLQKVLLGLAGDAVWSDELSLVLAGEAEVECPGCGEELLLCLEPGESTIESGFSSAQAQRLHAEAVRAGLTSVAESLTRLFGRFACPACGTTFAVADAVEDQVVPAARRGPASRAGLPPEGPAV